MTKEELIKTIELNYTGALHEINFTVDEKRGILTWNVPKLEKPDLPEVEEKFKKSVSLGTIDPTIILLEKLRTHLENNAIELANWRTLLK